MADSANPYASPLSDASLPLEAQAGAAGDWRVIARQWERWRWPYNALMLLGGGVWFLFNPVLLLFAPLAIVYGLIANVCYLLGPVGQLYLMWVADWLEGRTPEAIPDLLRSPWVFYLLWGGGTLFSLAVTVSAGALAALKPEILVPIPN